MRYGWLPAAALAALLVTGTARADGDDKKDDSAAKALAKIAKLGPGVHAIRKDDRGRIKTCVVVGEARISTVLGKGKGLETARARARLAAAAEFRKWLREKVTVYENSESETITLLEGKEGGDGDALKESGKALEKTTARYTTVAEGLVSGLQVLHAEVSGDDKTYTLVLGWDAATAKAAGQIDRERKRGGDDKPGAKGGEARKPGARDGAGKKPEDKKIGNKSTTSGDAKKFVD